MTVLRVFAIFALGAVAACGNDTRAVKTAPVTGADRVLVVVNTQSSPGEQVGEYYRMHRSIAPSHVVTVSVEIDDEISDLDFRAKFLKPVRATLDSLSVRIDFIVLTTGVPIRIGGGRGYSVDAMLAGMNLPIPPMVGFDSTWLARYRNPYYNAVTPFNSDRFGMYLVTRLDCGQLAD